MTARSLTAILMTAHELLGLEPAAAAAVASLA